jgi:hypothetical protein
MIAEAKGLMAEGHHAPDPNEQQRIERKRRMMRVYSQNFASKKRQLALQSIAI